MSNQLWGPFHPIPDCRLWIAEDHTSEDATESELIKRFAEARLTDRDRNRWNRYRPLTKKRQFLSSRLAIQSVLNCEFGTDSADLVVDTMESGLPILMDSQRRQVASISLSHAGNLTTIALSKTHYGLGTDIEILQRLNARTFLRSFINQREHDQLLRESFVENPDVALAIWTLKEAFWKALGGPKDTALNDITVEYRNALLGAHISDLAGTKKPVAAQLFGRGYSFPRELKNYSSTNTPESKTSAFIGCVVLVDAMHINNG